MKNDDTSTPITGSEPEEGVNRNPKDVSPTIESTEGMGLPLDSSRDETSGLRRIARHIAIAYPTWGLIFLSAPVSVYILTHNLTPKEFGIYSLCAVLIRFLPRLVVMGSHLYLTRKRSEIDSPAIEKVYSNVTRFTHLFGVVIIAGLIFFTVMGGFEKGVLAGRRHELLVTLLAAYMTLAFLANRNIIYSVGRLELYNLLTLSWERLWVVFLLVLVMIGRVQILHVLWVIALAHSVMFFISARCIPRVLSFRHRMDWSQVREYLWYGLPLLPYLAGFGWQILIDRYMLAIFVSVEAVAFYTLAHTVMTMLTMVGVILSSTLFPHLAARLKSDRTLTDDAPKSYRVLFNLSLKYIYVVTIPALVLLVFLRESVVRALSGPDYLPSADLMLAFTPYVLCAVGGQVLVQNVLLRKDTKSLALGYWVAVIVHIVLMVTLVQYMGVFAAILATSVSNLVILCTTFMLSDTKTLLDPSLLRGGRILIATAAMAAVVYSTTQVEWPFDLAVGSVVGIVCFIAVFLAIGGLTDWERTSIKQVVLGRTGDENLKHVL